MPEVPRDPRQLARDILSGKVRIEDLARERQLRGGQPPARVPDKIPLPRPAPPPQPRSPTLPPPMPRPIQRAPAPVQRQQTRVVTPPVRQAPPVQRPQQRLVVTPASGAKRPDPPPTPPPTSDAMKIVPKPVRRPISLRALARSKHAMRQGVLLAEVLNKPIALREDLF